MRVGDPHYPAFCRVIWNAHVREMSDLDAEDRRYLMEVVFAVEVALRRLLNPLKINLASFGNVVPHLHWHVIPRWADDRHFPEPVWGTVRREGGSGRPAPVDGDLIAALTPVLDLLESERRKQS